MWKEILALFISLAAVMLRDYFSYRTQRKEGIEEAEKKQKGVDAASEHLLAESLASSRKLRRKIENLQDEMDQDRPTEGDQ